MYAFKATVLLLLALLAAVVAAAPKAAHAESVPQVSSAVDGVLALFRQKSVVALADAHGLAQEEDFYSALVRDPRFAEQVGNVVVEFGGEIAQSTINRYVAGEEVPFTELRRAWTDVAGWFPGESQIIGFVNFYAAVRAANLKLPPAQRIKVWLGDPSIVWSQTHSFQDVQPLLRKRDDNMFRIIQDEILGKHRKTLLIVGSGHLYTPGRLGSLINQAAPGELAIVAPFIGYIEPHCNDRFVAAAKSWPTPALAGPVAGTTLQSQLQLPGCNYIPPEQLERMQKMAASGAPAGAQMSGPRTAAPGPGMTLPGAGKIPPSGGPPGQMGFGGGKPQSPQDILAHQIDVISGDKADAILYLGPPQTLTRSPLEPSTYLDLDYFKELSRRMQCCTPGGKPLDWEEMLQQSSAAPRVFKFD
jgi:hypothetical protein